jgi:hypothetical protein
MGTSAPCFYKSTDCFVTIQTAKQVFSTSNLLTSLPSLAIQVYIGNHLCGHHLGGGSELLCLHLVGVP